MASKVGRDHAIRLTQGFDLLGPHDAAKRKPMKQDDDRTGPLIGESQ